ncbi:MAG TPA: arginine deiminase family protein [Chryseolinea sp.]|nr:arginine deiminase family protein [Chryseolinea sp.]
MKLTCHSDVGEIRSVFLKKVADAFVDESKIVAEWKALNFLEKPDLKLAVGEYHSFEELVAGKGLVHYFPRRNDVSMDSIYCRDASVATDGGMILCNMGKPGRRSEPEAARHAFESAGINILGAIEAPGTLEGGDVAWLDDHTLAVGHTYRTNPEGIRQLTGLLSGLSVEVISVPLPHYKGPTDVFHLMSILSPVDHDLAVVYSPLMPIAFRNELLRRNYNLIEVPDDEFESMGCNVLALAPRQCLMVRGNPKTRTALETAGCAVFEYEGKEISVKGGGGPTCLTRPVVRAI